MSNPIPKPSQLPAVVAPNVGPVGMSDKELDRACVALNLVRFNSKTIKALKVVGAALEAADIARIQVTKVLLTQDKLQDLLEKLEKLMNDSADEPQTMIEAVRAATAVCSESSRASELAVKILETKLIAKEEVARKYRSFAPGEQVSPIQVNIRTSGGVEVGADSK